MGKRGKRPVPQSEFVDAAASFHKVGAALDALAALMREAKVSEFHCEANTLLSQAADLHEQALRLKSQFEIERAVVRPRKTPKTK